MDIDKEFELLKQYMKYYIECLEVCYGGLEYATTEFKINKNGSITNLGSNSYLAFGPQNIKNFETWKINK